MHLLKQRENQDSVSDQKGQFTRHSVKYTFLFYLVSLPLYLYELPYVVFVFFFF